MIKNNDHLKLLGEVDVAMKTDVDIEDDLHIQDADIMT